MWKERRIFRVQLFWVHREGNSSGVMLRSIESHPINLRAQELNWNNTPECSIRASRPSHSIDVMISRHSDTRLIPSVLLWCLSHALRRNDIFSLNNVTPDTRKYINFFIYFQILLRLSKKKIRNLFLKTAQGLVNPSESLQESEREKDHRGCLSKRVKQISPPPHRPLEDRPLKISKCTDGGAVLGE